MLFRLFTVVAMLALAVSTWILSAPGRTPGLEAAAQPVQTPGYYLQGAILTEFGEGGAPTLRIAADRIDQVGHGSEIALHGVRVDYEAPAGTAPAAWIMTGEQARVEAGGAAVDVSGDVRLTGQGVARGAGEVVVRADFLRYDVTGGIASTPDEVHVDFDRQTLNARGLAVNLHDRTLHLESHVNGRFHP
jgi:LPS export ABC transporter protein LptC